jgi:sugar-specific transcriptional regulator TrmB
MSGRAQRIEQLRRLGLSDYQAKLYLSLAEGGRAGAGELARRAGVPRGRIYEILRAMEAQGLVDVTPEKPTRFTAVPVKEMLDRRALALEQDADELERRRDEIGRMFRPARPPVEEPRPTFHVLRGRKHISSQFRRLAREAARSLEIQVSAEAPPEARSTVARSAADAVGRRLAVRLVSCFDDSVPPEIRKLTERIAGAVRLQHAPHSLNLLIADQSSLLLWNARARAGDREGEDEVAILTEDLPTVRSFRGILEERWASAGDPAVVIERLKAGAPLEGFELIRSTAEAFRRYQDSLLRARRSVADLTSSTRLAQLAAGSPQVVEKPSSAALRDLVHVAAADVAGLRHFHPRSEVHHLPVDFGLRFTVVDARETFFFSPLRLGDDVRSPYADTLYSDRPEVAEVFQAVFDHLWALSVPVGERLREIETGEPPPREFVLIRSSDEALAKYRDAVRAASTEVRDLTSSERLRQLAALDLRVFNFPVKAAIYDLVNVNRGNLEAVERFAPGANVRHVPTDFGLRFSVIDSRETFLFPPIRPGDPPDAAYAGTLYSDNPEVARVYLAVFDHLWGQSTPMDEFLKTGGPRKVFEVVRSGAETLSRLRSALEGARDEILDVTSGSMLERLRALALPKVRIRAGVRCRDLAHVTESNLESVAQFPWEGELRHTPADLGLRFTVIDNRHVYVFPPVRETDSGDEPYAGTVYCDDFEVAATYTNIFEHLWSQATPSDTRMRQLQDGHRPGETKVLLDRDRALAVLRESLESARDEVLSMSTGDALEWRMTNLGWLEGNLDRVRRKMILQATGPDHPVLSRLSGIENAEVRITESDIGLRLAVVDGRTVLLIPQGKGSGSALSAEGWKEHGGMIVSSDHAFAEVYARLFRELWEAASAPVLGPGPGVKGYRMR